MPARATMVRLGALLLMALLAGCSASGGMSDLRQYVKRVEAQPGPPLEPIPKIEPYKAYTYADQGMRSPFSPVQDEQATSSVHPDYDRRKEYLEQFPLDSLAMVGVITMDGTRYALIQDPNGLVHKVHQGNYIGRNDGRIIAIGKTGLTLREIVPNGLGGYVKRTTKVPLSTDDAGAGA